MSGSNLSQDSAPQPAPRDHAQAPLGLTVHSLPVVDEAAVAARASQFGPRLKLLLVMLVCVAPIMASYFTYYVVRPEGRRNYGELNDPQREMPNMVGIDLQGRQVALSALKDQWLLISVGDSACGEGCEKHLYLSRQLRESLGKDKERVDWVWLRTGTADIPSRLLPGLSTAKVLKLESAELAAWLRPAEGRQLTDHLYLVDPMGHWMMRFPADADPVKVRKDLERLMRGASSWDKEGRP